MEEHVIDGGAMNDLSGILHQHIGMLAGGQCRHLLQVAEQVAQRGQQVGEGNGQRIDAVFLELGVTVAGEALATS